MKIIGYKTHRLVKSEDLNHHGTLFAGRTAEWFVESGFIAASSMLNPRNIVCLRIHGMQFSLPVKAGETICFTGKVVHTGRTSLVAYIKVNRIKFPDENIVDGFITFVHVDDSTKPCPHGIVMEPDNDEDAHLNEKAKNLSR
jgi:acyl-CoA hydrolase